VFTAGDVTCKEVRQAVVAAAEGWLATLAADKHINRRAKLRPSW